MFTLVDARTINGSKTDLVVDHLFVFIILLQQSEESNDIGVLQKPNVSTPCLSDNRKDSVEAAALDTHVCIELITSAVKAQHERAGWVVIWDVRSSDRRRLSKARSGDGGHGSRWERGF